MPEKILMVIAQEGFRDEELQIPQSIFNQAGYQVHIASKQTGRVIGKLGAEVSVDVALNDLAPNDYCTVVFVGGPGVKQYWEDTSIHQIAKDFHAQGKYVTAICSAPVILSRAGLVAGRRVTAFPGDEQEINRDGAIYIGSQVEIDGQFITANGPKAAKKFAEKIIEKLNH